MTDADVKAMSTGELWNEVERLRERAADAERERDEARATEKAARQAFADTMLRAESALAAERARVKVLEEALRNVLPYVYTGAKDGSDRIREAARAALAPPGPSDDTQAAGTVGAPVTITVSTENSIMDLPIDERIAAMARMEAEIAAADAKDLAALAAKVASKNARRCGACSGEAAHIDASPLGTLRQCCGGERCCMKDRFGWTTRALAHGKEAGR